MILKQKLFFSFSFSILTCHCLPRVATNAPLCAYASLTVWLYSVGWPLNKKIGILECSTLCSSIDEHTHWLTCPTTSSFFRALLALRAARGQNTHECFHLFIHVKLRSSWHQMQSPAWKKVPLSSRASERKQQINEFHNYQDQNRPVLAACVCLCTQPAASGERQARLARRQTNYIWPEWEGEGGLNGDSMALVGAKAENWQRDAGLWVLWGNSDPLPHSAGPAAQREDDWQQSRSRESEGLSWVCLYVSVYGGGECMEILRVHKPPLLMI